MGPSEPRMDDTCTSSISLIYLPRSASSGRPKLVGGTVFFATAVEVQRVASLTEASDASKHGSDALPL